VFLQFGTEFKKFEKLIKFCNVILSLTHHRLSVYLLIKRLSNDKCNLLSL